MPSPKKIISRSDARASAIQQLMTPASKIIHLDASQIDTVVFDYDTNKHRTIKTVQNGGTLGGTFAPSSSTVAPRHYISGIDGPMRDGFFFDNGIAKTNYKDLNFGSTYPVISGTGAENGITAFAVVTPIFRDGTNQTFVCDFGNYTAGGWGFGCRPGRYNCYTPTGSGGAVETGTSSTVRYGEPVLLTLRIELGLTVKMRINGTQVYSASIASLTNLDTTISKSATHVSNAGPFTIGRASESMGTGDYGLAFNGLVHEIMIYNAAMIDADIATIEAQLSSKWLLNALREDSRTRVLLSPQDKSTVTFETKTSTKTTISGAVESTTVTGVGTLFTSELSVGDYIVFNPGGYTECIREVFSIASNTSLTVTEPFTVSTGPSSLWEYRSGGTTSIANAGTLGGTFAQSTSSKKPMQYSGYSDDARALYFDGSDDSLESSLPESSFKFMHDGTGYTAFVFAKVYTYDSDAPFFSTCPLGASFEVGTWFGTLQSGSVVAEPRTLDFAVANGSAIVVDGQDKYDLPVERWAIYCIRSSYSSPTSTIDVFIDGHKISTTTSSSSTPSSSDPSQTLKIAQFIDAPSTSLNAQINFIAILEGAISDADVADYTNEIAAKFDHAKNFNPKAYSSNLVGWWDSSDYGTIEFAKSNGTGTISSSVSSPGTVTGVSTAFLTEIPSTFGAIEYFYRGVKYYATVLSTPSDTSMILYKTPDLPIPVGTSFVYFESKADAVYDKSATSTATFKGLTAPTSTNRVEWAAVDPANFVRFNYFAGDISAPSYFANTTVTTEFTLPVTMYYVFSAGIVSGDEILFDGGVTNKRPRFQIQSSTEHYRFLGGVTYDTEMTYISERAIIKVTYNDTSSTMSINGADEITFAGPNQNLQGQAMLATFSGASPSSAWIHEWMIFDEDVSGVDNAIILSNLGQKYEVEIAKTLFMLKNIYYYWNLTKPTQVNATATDIVTVFPSVGLLTAGSTSGARANYTQNTFLSRPGAVFNGTSDYMTMGSGLVYTVLHNGNPSTLAIIFSVDSPPASTAVLLNTARSSSDNGVLATIDTSGHLTYTIYNGSTTVASVTTTSSVCDGSIKSVVIVFDNGRGSDNLEMRINDEETYTDNTQDTPSSSPSSNSMTVASLNGSTQFLALKLAEIIVLEKDIFNDDYTTYQSYVFSRYSIG